MRVPKFKTKKIRDDIFGLVDQAPFRSMYSIVMSSIDYAMGDLLSMREQIPESEANKKTLAKYDQHFAEFGEREAYYFQAFLEAEDRSVVDAPLFDGDYSGFDFLGSGPDIETPWILANELAQAAALGSMDQSFLDELKRKFKQTVTDFWSEASRLIELEKEKVESNEVSMKSFRPGRRYGFLPYLAIGAVALVGVLGTAAGYSFAKSKEPEKYVAETFWGKHKKTAKNVGIGFAAGALAIILIRSRR